MAVAAGGLAAPPVIPNESIDPIRFCNALSAMVADASFCTALAADPDRRPSDVRLPIVNCTGAAAGAWPLAIGC